MSKHVPLEEIKEMDGKQRLWLQTICDIKKGYYDAEKDEFVVLMEGG